MFFFCLLPSVYLNVLPKNLDSLRARLNLLRAWTAMVIERMTRNADGKPYQIVQNIIDEAYHKRIDIEY